MTGKRPRDPQLDWAERGPRSGRSGDVYFSADDGLAESRAVFLAGCGLPQAWRGRDRFVVGELGFGSGLNILALLDLWRRDGPPGACLHVFSIEAFPFSPEEATRAHALWPELADLSSQIVARWPAPTPGFHRMDLAELRTTIDVAVGDVTWALREWSGRADAWFLDGFSPASNPEMWSLDALRLVAARSAPGARAATFTVAGDVRRGLQAAGFEVAKRPGFGRKRERLEARLPEAPALRRSRIRSAAVIGAGIAGASLARALRRQGVDAAVIDPGGPGAGASGAPAALVSPRIDAGGGAVAAFFSQAAGRAGEIYLREAPDAVLARGVLRLEQSDRDGSRFDRVAAQELWPDGAMERLTRSEAARRLGEPLERGGLWAASALVIDPRTVLAALLDGCEIVRKTAVRVDEVGDRVRVVGHDDAVLLEVDAAFVAAGPDSPLLGAPLMQPVRGQVSVVKGAAGPAVPFAWGGYAAPTRDGWLFGATHDRDDRSDEIRDGDDARNLAALKAVAPGLAGRAEAAGVRGRASVRATTRDRMPVAGGLAPRVFVLTGLGSRGFLAAPLLAEHVVAEAVGAPSPLPESLSRLIEPGRRGIEFG